VRTVSTFRTHDQNAEHSEWQGHQSQDKEDGAQKRSLLLEDTSNAEQAVNGLAVSEHGYSRHVEGFVPQQSLGHVKNTVGLVDDVVEGGDNVKNCVAGVH